MGKGMVAFLERESGTSLIAIEIGWGGKLTRKERRLKSG